MTLNSYPFKDEKEENSKPIGRYPIPYKKDLPFDIVELMEEMERKVRYTLLQGSMPVGSPVLASVIASTACHSLPKLTTVGGPFLGPGTSDHMFFLLASASLLCPLVLCSL